MSLTKMRKLIFYSVIIFLTFLIAYILFGFLFKPKPTIMEIKPSIAVENSTITQLEIAEKIMNERLQGYKSSNVVKLMRIKNYKIYSIDVIKQTETGFIFDVIFAIKPYIKESYWQAGNGVYNDSSGWIECKGESVRVIRKNNTYKYDRSATGDICE